MTYRVSIFTPKLRLNFLFSIGRSSLALSLICLLFSTGTAFGGTRHDERENDWNWKNTSTETKAICAAFNDDFRFPPKDQPTEAEKHALMGCDSDTFTLGLKGPVDHVMARKCAFVEMEKEDWKIFGGSAKLMEIYANGQGVKHDLNLALNISCYISGAPAEYNGRVANLQKKRAAGWKGNHFTICDDITSGFMSGACRSRDERVTKAKRQQRFGKLLQNWNGREKDAFDQLLKASEEYFNKRVSEEIDLSGTLRSSFMVEEESNLQNSLLQALQALEEKQTKNYSAAEYKQADAELNRVYRQIQQNNAFHYGTVKRQGIKQTQRKWIHYRDAWVAFCLVRYPWRDAGSIKTRLTLERTIMLKEFLN